MLTTNSNYTAATIFFVVVDNIIILPPSIAILQLYLSDSVMVMNETHLSVFYSISNHARGKHSRNSVSSMARYAFTDYMI